MANYDLQITQGATYAFDLQIDGVNLTGFAARFVARYGYTSTPALLDLSVGSGLTITYDSQTGGHTHIVLSISATATAALVADTHGVYDLQYSQSGIVTNTLAGSYYVLPQVMR